MGKGGAGHLLALGHREEPGAGGCTEPWHVEAVASPLSPSLTKGAPGDRMGAASPDPLPASLREGCSGLLSVALFTEAGKGSVITHCIHPSHPDTVAGCGFSDTQCFPGRASGAGLGGQIQSSASFLGLRLIICEKWR